ncbi:hypothetical protein [Streptomyces sp. SID2563]|nr:hypothetical protein [Streptomyces sp. SID2563]
MAATQQACLDTCREGLSYNTRWHQSLRKRKEKRFLRQLTAG